MNTLITETTEFGEMAVDVYQKLSNDRILFICNTITDDLATHIVATLLLRDSEDSKNKITLFVNSDGGDIRNALMIYDAMNMVNSPIETVCIGSAHDEAAIILAGGTQGMRFATKNSVISVSQLVHSWYTQTDMVDAHSLMNQAASDNKKMMDIFAKATGKTTKQVMLDFERKIFMNAQQAVKYKLIDKVVSFKK